MLLPYRPRGVTDGWMPGGGEGFLETSTPPRRRTGMWSRRFAEHWTEYVIEAGALGTFMVSAAVFAGILYHPSSCIAAGISNGWVRRGLMGLAMGATAVSIIYSPWGQ